MPLKAFVISDMEGVAGIVKWEQTTGGDPTVRGGTRALHGGDQRGRPRRAAGGATEVVVMDCHGAGGAGASTR